MSSQNERSRPTGTPGRTAPETVPSVPVSTEPGERSPRYDRLVKIDAATALPGRPDGLQAAAAYTDESWLTRALSVVRVLADAGVPFTVADVRAAVPEPEDRTRWGALIAVAVKRRIITSTGEWRTVPGKSCERAVHVWIGAAHHEAGGGAARGD